MAKNNNLQDFLTDVANSIRTKTGTTAQINAQDFSSKIESIETGITPTGTLDITTNGIVDVTNYEKANVNVPSGGGNTLKNLLDATHNARYLFVEYTGTSVDNLIQPNDTENVTNMSNMFEYCTNLTSIPQLNTSNVTEMNAMFENCYNLTTIPLLDTTSVRSMRYMFQSCSNLTSVPEFNLAGVTDMSNMFDLCFNLKSILMFNIENDLDISSSTKFERSDLLIILNNLNTVTYARTLTMGADNLAKLTEEDKAIATNKGWTLA